MASRAEVQETVGTLEVSGRSESYCGFGTGLRGVTREFILVCFGIGDNSMQNCFAKLTLKPFMSVCGGIV